MDRKERFVKAFNYLRGKGAISTQKELADMMCSTPSNVSSALKGVESVLTDNFIMRFVRLFPEFSMPWMLNGEGEMLVRNSSFLIDESANDDVVQQSETTRKLIESLENLVKAQQVHIAYLDKEIANKNEEIKALKSSKRDGRDWGGFGVSTTDERAKK